MKIINKTAILRGSYQKLVKIFPDKPWNLSISKLNKTKSATIIELSEYYIAYGVALWGEGKYFNEPNEYDVMAMNEALFYCGKIMEYADSLEEVNKDKLLARFKAAFGQPNDMRALVFEVFMYYSLGSFGYVVEPKDDDAMGETYDYLVNNGNKEIQVECKSFSYDKGLILSGEDAYELALNLLSEKLTLTNESERNISVLTVELTSESLMYINKKKVLARKIVDSLNAGEYSTNEFNLYLESFDDVDDINDIDSWIKLPIKKRGIEIATVASMPDGMSNRICLLITTPINNSFLRNFEKICNKAAKKQLGDTKPSSIAIHFSNYESLYESCINSSQFNNKINLLFKQKHIISVLFVSNISVYEEERFPFFSLAPRFEEIRNVNSIYYDDGPLKPEI
ncbi:hypothetical protein GTP43_10230 [Vibrio cholerae]|nr:hypothetical protein [Vibrio cholerae]